MRYAVLLKGINVGGKNIVRMDDLKQLLLALGLCEVKTYIQSGNAVFETALGEAVLHETIRTGFIDRFGFESDVLIQSEDILRTGKRELYLLCRQSIRGSKLAARIAKVFDSATTRNWKTVNQLYAMMRDKGDEHV